MTRLLEESGNNLIERAREYSIKNHQTGDIYKMLDLILLDFRNWKNSVIRYLKQDKKNESIINNINNSDDLFINPNQWALDAIKSETKRDAFRLYINNVNKILKELKTAGQPQINRSTPSNLNKIKITISDKGIYRIKDGKELPYKSVVRSKRRKLINYLLEATEPIPGAELMEKIDYATKESLSKEIININDSFIKRLKFPKLKKNDLIVNNQTGDGYFLNSEKYFFE